MTEIHTKEVVMETFRDFDMDSISSLVFSPDPLSWYQYGRMYKARTALHHAEPLGRLMVAVLEDAIACFQAYWLKPSPKNEKLYREADEWIASDSDDPFSFSNVCENLGINPKWLRQGLFRWKERQMRKAVEDRKRVAVQGDKPSSRSCRPPKYGP